MAYSLVALVSGVSGDLSTSSPVAVGAIVSEDNSNNTLRAFADSAC